MTPAQREVAQQLVIALYLCGHRTPAKPMPEGRVRGVGRIVACGLLLASSACAHGPVKRTYLLPASIPPEDRVCVEQWPPELERWSCLPIGDLRQLLDHLSRANP